MKKPKRKQHIATKPCSVSTIKNANPFLSNELQEIVNFSIHPLSLYNLNMSRELETVVYGKKVEVLNKDSVDDFRNQHSFSGI